MAEMSDTEQKIRQTVKEAAPGMSESDLDAFINEMRREHREAMADPDNIDLDLHVRKTKILGLLDELWDLNPSYRFMQMLFNAGALVSSERGMVHDPFYLQDEALVQTLSDAVEAAKRSGGCKHGGFFRGEQCTDCGEIA